MITLPLLALPLLLASIVPSHGGASGPPAGTAATVCFPPAWDAIVPGVTQDHHTRRLYGDGYFSPEGGHGGTRYFVAADSSYTVAAEIGTDQVIESVDLISGVALPDGVPASAALSKLLPPIPEIDRVRLGFTKDRVRGVLGTPSTESTADRWVYETDYRDTDCYPFAEATFTFSDAVLVRMSVYVGD